MNEWERLIQKMSLAGNRSICKGLLLNDKFKYPPLPAEFVWQSCMTEAAGAASSYLEKRQKKQILNKACTIFCFMNTFRVDFSHVLNYTNRIRNTDLTSSKNISKKFDAW